MQIQLVTVPYDSGHYGVRMGGGPDALIAGGLPDVLRAGGHDVKHIEITLPSASFTAEVQSAFALDRLLAERVSDAVAAGALPIVLSGNCISSIGTLAGLALGRIGIVWFDAHGDFNTPETTVGGFLDGMALATVTGRCWSVLAASVSNFRPVPEDCVVLIGARDLDAAEKTLLDESAIAQLPPSMLRALFQPVMDDLASRVSEVYVHVDLDVLDLTEGRANSYAASGGLHVDEVVRAVTEIGRRFTIGAAALTAYDPAYDGDGRVRTAAARIARAIADAAALSLQRPSHQGDQERHA
jgi:arginase